MTIKVIIRVDDIKNRFDFNDLRKWFIKNFPQIPICFYACYTHYKYMWQKSGWKKIKDTILKFKWEIGGHSRRHSHLNQISKAELKNDIGKNIHDIENGLKSVGLNYKVTSFAYPYGEFNNNVKESLKEYEIIHGLTYIEEKKYKSQLKISDNNLYEIGISCNAKNLVEDWNKRFIEVLEKGDTYILCLHTPHWSRADNRKNFLRLFKSRSFKAFYTLIKYFFRYYSEESELYKWDMLKQHLNFILSHPDIQFITFKDLIKK